MPKAIVGGGGIAGLASGIAFAKAGWDVTVLERARRIEPMGAAPIRRMLLATRALAAGWSPKRGSMAIFT